MEIFYINSDTFLTNLDLKSLDIFLEKKSFKSEKQKIQFCLGRFLVKYVAQTRFNIQNPEIVYIDNPKKAKEIEKEIKATNKKFIDFFGSDEIITTNKFADDVIGLFNDFAEGGEKKDFSDKIQLPEKFQFFNVAEFNNSYDNFLENSLGGFSSHKETYDVGIVYDEELGMYAVPFWGTFNRIFEADKPSDIQNYDKCIQYFLFNDKFSANLIKRVAEKHENFLPIVNGILKTDYTLEELLQRYKSHYLDLIVI